MFSNDGHDLLPGFRVHVRLCELWGILAVVVVLKLCGLVKLVEPCLSNTSCLLRIIEVLFDRCATGDFDDWDGMVGVE